MIQLCVMLLAALVSPMPSVALPSPSPSPTLALIAPSTSGTPWSASERLRLNHDLAQILASADPSLRRAHIGLAVVETGSGTPLYLYHADDDFQPASNLKALTGSAALQILGPDFRFHTSIDAAGTVDGTTLRGDLVVHGGGDPYLRATDLDAAAAAIAASGIHEVTGGVRADATHFDDEAYPPGWTVDDIPYYYSPIISGLCLEENTLHLMIGAGAAVGDPPTIAVTPQTNVITVENHATTGVAHGHNSIDFTRPAPSVIDVVGSIPIDDPPDDENPSVPDPQAYLADVFAERLAAVGVTVDGANLNGPAAPGVAAREVWHHDSEPLSALLATFWYTSDNLVGEVLLKELGAHTHGAPGRSDDGIAAEQPFLHAVGVDPNQIDLHDGSGLSRYDRFTPRAFTRIFQYDWRSPNRNVVVAALPVAGIRGSIKGDYFGTPLVARLYGKTGSYMHVRAISGYLQTLHHGAVTYSLMIDDWIGDSAPLRALQTALLERLLAP